MFDKQENRLNERFPYEASVMLYTKDNSENHYYGRICNHSQGGMYIKTDADLKGDQCYVVKIPHDRDTFEGSEKYTEYYGIVRWAQFINSPDSSDTSFTYGYGMEYIQPATSWCKSC